MDFFCCDKGLRVGSGRSNIPNLIDKSYKLAPKTALEQRFGAGKALLRIVRLRSVSGGIEFLPFVGTLGTSLSMLTSSAMACSPWH